MSELILGGDVTAYVTFSGPEAQAAAVETVRVEQEQICGYPLAIKGTRQSHYQDDKGRDVYELWATFAPAPPEPEPMRCADIPTGGSDGTRA